MVILISVTIIALILISLLVFGGGQVFMPVFSWFWQQMWPLGMKVSQEQINQIFTIANSTPGVLSLKLAASTGFLIGDFGVFNWILALFFLLIFTLPAIFLIIIWLQLQKRYAHKNIAFWTNLIKIFKPIILGIIVALCFQIFINLILVNYSFNTNNGYILPNKIDNFLQGWRFWVYITFGVFWTITSLILYIKKTNVFLIIIFGVILAFLCLQPWI